MFSWALTCYKVQGLKFTKCCCLNSNKRKPWKYWKPIFWWNRLILFINQMFSTTNLPWRSQSFENLGLIHFGHQLFKFFYRFELSQLLHVFIVVEICTRYFWPHCNCFPQVGKWPNLGHFPSPWWSCYL